MESVDLNKYPFLSTVVIVLLFFLLVLAGNWLKPVTEVIKKEADRSREIKNEGLMTAPEISVQERKEQFRATVIPVINAVHASLVQRYLKVEAAVKAGAADDKFVDLLVEYNASDNEELLLVLKPHPVSITIAQAAMESSWGTSRFFNEANNVFGIWSFSKNEPRLAAAEKRGEKTIWLKKYASVADSVRDYYRVLARGDAYKAFRRLRMKTSDPYELVMKLDRYSEKGVEYSRALAAIIRFNNFYSYDQPATSL